MTTTRRALIALLLLLLPLFGCASTAERAGPRHWIVFLNRNPDAPQIPAEEVRALGVGHMENIRRLAGEGSLLLAGPRDGGGGIFLMRGDGRAAIEALCATDPAIAARRFRLEIFELDYERRRLGPVPDPVEMEHHTFVRVERGGAQRLAALLAEHDLTARTSFLGSLPGGRAVAVLAPEPDDPDVERLRAALGEPPATESVDGIWLRSAAFAPE